MTTDPYAGLKWHDAFAWGVEGVAFSDREAPADRLPRDAKEPVGDTVWFLACQSAGASVRFVTDALEIFARWRLAYAPQASAGETALSRAGLDLYGRDADGTWHWTGSQAAWRLPELESDGQLHKVPLDGRKREYRIYLPLAARPVRLEIGVRDATLEGLAPDPAPPIVYYGTSIVHGACVSRPGMTHSSILQRRLGIPMVNLGLSGNGRMEPAVMERIARIPARLFILDCLPNMSPEQITERMAPAVETLRRSHPTIPILCVADRAFTDAAFCPSRATNKAAKDAAQRAALAPLLARDPALHLYAPPSPDFGADHEGSPDSSHPSDLGSMRWADQMEPILRGLIAARP